MKNTIKILAVLVVGFGCQSSAGESENALVQDDNPPEVAGRVYANAEGQIELIELGDSLYQVIFTNNEGFQFDTTLRMEKLNPAQNLYPWGNSGNLLAYRMGGLMIEDNRIDVYDRIEVYEFSGSGRLFEETKIKSIYQEPFFLLNEQLTVKGDIYSGKTAHSISGIYLGFEKLPGKSSDTYYEVTGTIKKEAYPLSYYSTDESPQGMFDSDTSVKYYRLVMQNVEINLPKTEYYRGTTINDSENRAGIAWELADSELFLIWGRDEPWSEDEVLKDIGVNAVYVHEKGYSWLKNIEYLH